MAEENEIEEKTESEDSLSVSEDDELDLDEMDEDEEPTEEEKEVGAYLVIGQGDFSMTQSNRGADDPGDNTLSEPQYVAKYGDMLFVSDRGNHRVVIWEQFPEENGEPCSLVLGQEDFADCLENRGMTTTLDEMTSGLGDEDLDGFTISKSEEDTLSQPAGLQVIDGKLYVVDSGNHRILRWSGLPSEDGEAPSLVLGQDNLDDNEANRRGFVGSGSLFFPMGIFSSDDQHIFVADKDNHRVLVWNKIPFSDGWNADVSLGQGGMDERWPNRGEFDNVGADTLSFPMGVHFDAESERVVVVDQGNNRVLIWNKLPRETGVAADVVIGQKDFFSREPNSGKGYKRACQEGMYFPTDVVCGDMGMFVSDTGNNRVLYWKEVPTENGQLPDLVLGQVNFNDNKANRVVEGEATASTLDDPFGMFLIEEEEEDDSPRGIPMPDDDDDDEDTSLVATEGGDEIEEEEPKPKFKLFIADRGNSRVVVWDELPYPKEEEEDEEEFEELQVDDENLLIGDDDDDDFFDEDEEDEVPPGELPSA